MSITDNCQCMWINIVSCYVDLSCLTVIVCALPRAPAVAAIAPAVRPASPRRRRAARASRGRPSPVAAVTDYPLKGVVKRVEKELEHVTIEHEAIPGFMDAMRMRFAYKDKTVLGAAPARRPGGRDVAGRAGRRGRH